jgi:hypothetical protein
MLVQNVVILAYPPRDILIALSHTASDMLSDKATKGDKGDSTLV